MSAVGFDIGSENSYIAVVISGGIEILDNEYSLRSTPTYIGFNNKCRDIGVAARTKLITNLENSAFGFKRILGKKHDDNEIHDELSYLPLEVCDLPSGNIGIKVKYLNNVTVFSIEQLMAMILTKLKTITEIKLGNNIRDCVISVPVYYTDAQRRAMLDAVNIAGLNAVKLVNEPTAIALFYGFFRRDLSHEELKNIVFIDLGKSCLTVTACEFIKDKARILGCVWDHVGGRDFDNVLVKYFVDDFKTRYNINVLTSKKALMTLIMECEGLKKNMSGNPLEVGFQIECFMNDLDVSGKMKREKFEALSEQVLNKIELNFLRCLEKTHLKPSDINSVEIVGGSTRVPAVKELIRKVFSRRPNETLNQDEAVARGCAIQGAILSPSFKTRNYIFEDVPPYVVKITYTNKDSEVETLELFSLSDKMPSFKLATICMNKPFLVRAYYVDPREKLCEIGTFILHNIPDDIEKSGYMKVKIKACLNIHGIFNIESAKAIKKIEKIQLKDEILSSADDNTDVPMTDNEEQISPPEKLSQEVQSVCTVESYDLNIISEVFGLTKLRSQEFINAEQQMICRDVEEKENADARNDLEEYLYDFRGKLNEELREFVLEEDKNELLQNLNEIEKWLEENYDLEAAEYFKKLRDLRSSFDPIFAKYSDWQQRQPVIDDYRQVLQQGFDVANNFKIEEDSTNVSAEEEVQSLLKIWEESKQYLDQYVEKVSLLQKTDDVPITVNELRSSLLNFKANFQNLFLEMQRKRNAAKKIPVSSSGDGLDENIDNSSPNVLPNESNN